MTYKVICKQCDYKQTAKSVTEAKYLRNEHQKIHFEVEYERTG